MAEQEQVIAEFQKNKSDVIRVSLSTFKGHDLINLRVWSEGQDGEVRPTKKGIAISTRLYDDLMDALSQVGGALNGGNGSGNAPEPEHDDGEDEDDIPF